MGESFYNPLLPVVVEELSAKGLLVEDDGALCVFPEGFENRNGEPLPLIVRKSDGGYGYPATDLACVRDRTGRIGATRLVYVVGAEQSLHLRLVFAVAALADYLPDVSAAVRRVRPRARDGRQEAGQPQRWLRAPRRSPRGDGAGRGRGKERSSDLSPERQAATAHALGVGTGVSTPTSPPSRPGLRLRLGPDAAFEGDTGPYLQYAHAASAPSSGGPRWRRPHPGRRFSWRAGGARPGPRAAPLRRGRRGHRRDLQPLEALHLPLRPRHRLHGVLRGLPGPGRRRGGALGAPRALRPHGESPRAGALAARIEGPQTYRAASTISMGN